MGNSSTYVHKRGPSILAPGGHGPRGGKGPRSPGYHFKIANELSAWIDECAKRNRVTRAEIARRAVAIYRAIGDRATDHRPTRGRFRGPRNASQSIQVRMESEEHAWVAALAERYDVTTRDILREALILMREIDPHRRNGSGGAAT